MLENTHTFETQAATAETLPRAHGWLARAFQQGDRFNAWLIGSQSQLSQQQLDEVDGLVRSPKAWLIGGVLSVLILATAYLFCVFDSRVVVQSMHDGTRHISIEIARQPLPGSFSLVAITLLLAVFWSVLDVWYGYGKYLGRLGGFLKLVAWVVLLPLALMILFGAAGVFLRTTGSPLQALGEMLVTRLLGNVAMLAVGLGMCVGAMLTVAFAHWRNKEMEELRSRLTAEAHAERMARQLSEAQLRLLQAQIEPHFLFNTLGAVQQLAEDGAPRAANLTASLIQFLRSSLAQLRNGTVTLGQDFTLVEAYLRIMQARLGSRLRYALELPPELASQTIPSMMLLTLVENAIKHGIEPALRGGSITVSASMEGGQLCLQVRDTGVGLPPMLEGGVGLANIRERLQLGFGERAGLVLLGQEEGALAELRLPPMDGAG
ncbi:hypothetical protein GCM10007907_31960 [Chitinimonas prasina]|uniref:Histidine kinase/HSP90-like ATPase domain-containing protein n=1 Tax=Chitinimonas prasina TaxID=1434937 RepID=A0ABQ5YHD1_9NEIS|nr:histidine kinase [Chitinimonas prasina]GLR14406.1 hypothetical protein GCM10007907_31960 [Chitinimonas prasina]